MASHPSYSFDCPFCSELNIPKHTTRGPDLKRHLKNFHNKNELWICPEAGCSKAFDWKEALKDHFKSEHSERRVPRDIVPVKIAPQVVFACGFTTCMRNFEVENDDDTADKKAEDFFEHIINHIRDNLSVRDWSYSARLRNLMCQKGVDACWKSFSTGLGWDLVWIPHSSYVLRRMLEIRHIPDPALLAQYAVNLGLSAMDPNTPVPALPPHLFLLGREGTGAVYPDSSTQQPSGANNQISMTLQTTRASPSLGNINEFYSQVPPTEVQYQNAVAQPLIAVPSHPFPFNPEPTMFGAAVLQPWPGPIPATISPQGPYQSYHTGSFVQQGSSWCTCVQTTPEFNPTTIAPHSTLGSDSYPIEPVIDNEECEVDDYSCEQSQDHYQVPRQGSISETLP